MKLAIVVPHFNPCGYRRQQGNLDRFTTALFRQVLHKYVCVLSPLRASDFFLWQKEAIINCAIRGISPEYDAIAWVDGDLLFQNPDWYEQTCRELEDYSVVQMFETIDYLGPDDEIQSTGYGTAAIGTRKGWRAPGGAIACRRELLEHGIYDRHVLGGGDEIFMEACIGRADRFYNKLNPPFRDHVRAWSEQFGQHEVGFVPGNVQHLWHGDRAGRQYKSRHLVLASHDFDPATDVRLSPNGLLEWASDKPELHQVVRDYFVSRNEDGAVTIPATDFHNSTE